MPRNLKSLMILGFALGLLPAALEGAGKPKPTCTDCEIVYTEAVNYTRGPQDLMLMKKDGTRKTVLLAGANGVLHKAPVWAPDGQWIAFSTNSTAGYSLRVIKNDGTGNTTVVPRCSLRVGGQTWRPIPSAGGYWLVFADERGSGGCTVNLPPGYSTPGQNLWAIHVSLGDPVITEGPLCLTCDLNAQDRDVWSAAAWSRDGFHISALQHKREANGGTYSFYIFDVDFGLSGEDPPALLGPASPFELPGLIQPDRTPLAPEDWAHWSDSLVMRTRDADWTYGLVKFEIDLWSVPKRILATTLLTAGSSYNFMQPHWSGDDQQLLVDAATGSAKTSGIYVVTPGPPFSMSQIASDSPRMNDSPDWKPGQ